MKKLGILVSFIIYFSFLPSAQAVDSNAPTCKTAGCNGELCVLSSAGNVYTTCVWQPQFACYQTALAKCEIQQNGQCGWTQTAALTSCLQNPTSISITPTIYTEMPTNQSIIPNVADWFWQVPETLQNFLEQLYVTVYYFNLPSNMAYLLEGIFGNGAPTPTGVASMPTNTPPITTTLPSPWRTYQTSSTTLDISGHVLWAQSYFRITPLSPTEDQSVATIGIQKTISNQTNYTVTAKYTFQAVVETATTRLPGVDLGIDFGPLKNDATCCDYPSMSTNFHLIHQPTINTLQINNYAIQKMTLLSTGHTVILNNDYTTNSTEYTTFLTNKTLWLRLKKTGQTLDYMISFDGTNWKQLATMNNSLLIPSSSAAMRIISSRWQQNVNDVSGYDTIITIDEQ